jgi:hypothetical protein
MDREVLAQTFMVLTFLPLLFVVVVAVRFFSQLVGRERPRVSEAQGLLWLSLAWFTFVMGAALLLLGVLEDHVAVFLPLGLAFVVVAVFIASRAMQLLRNR